MSTKIELTADMVQAGDAIELGPDVWWDVVSTTPFPHLNSVRVNLVHNRMAIFMTGDVVEVLRDDSRS